MTKTLNEATATAHSAFHVGSCSPLVSGVGPQGRRTQAVICWRAAASITYQDLRSNHFGCRGLRHSWIAGRNGMGDGWPGGRWRRRRCNRLEMLPRFAPKAIPQTRKPYSTLDGTAPPVGRAERNRGQMRRGTDDSRCSNRAQAAY